MLKLMLLLQSHTIIFQFRLAAQQNLHSLKLIWKGEVMVAIGDAGETIMVLSSILIYTPIDQPTYKFICLLIFTLIID